MSYYESIIFHLLIPSCYPIRVTMQGGCLNLRTASWTTTKASVSATAGRRLQVVPLMKKYNCPPFNVHCAVALSQMD